MEASDPREKVAAPAPSSGHKTPSRSSSGVSLSTIDENASGGAGNAEPQQRLERSASGFAGNSGILEAILAQKMTSASSLYLRSNSVHSVESAYSVHSGGGGSGGNNNNLENLERCHCDDCILGITDFLADFEATKLADKGLGKDASDGERPPILVRKVTC